MGTKFKFLLACLVFIALNSAAQFSSLTALEPLSIANHLADKPQSKVWFHAGQYWAVLPDSKGTHVWRLDGTSWTKILTTYPSSYAKADCKVVGNVTHILLFRGNNKSYMASVEYDATSNTYVLWNTRPSRTDIVFDEGVETATMEIDGSGRMWLASDAINEINVRWSDPPYTDWSAPITVASGITSDDICSIIALPGKIGVFWSNQNAKRFGFKTHANGSDPAAWSADEVPASQSALNLKYGMADDHINLAAASDGTLYCAVKTGYETINYPKVALLVRRSSGSWDNLYPVTTDIGVRPIVVLNEVKGKVKVIYSSNEGGADIFYKESSTSSISFGSQYALIRGGYNYPTSIKDTYNPSVVVLASTNTEAVGIIGTDGNSVPPPNPPALGSPQDLATGVGISPTLTWAVSPGADIYQVQVSAASDFSSTVFDESGIQGTSVQVSNLLYGTTYFWRIIASNSAGHRVWSSERRFKTASPPSDSLIPFQASWKYLDNGTDQGSGWRTTSFKDDGWKIGTGKFGYGISDAATVISYGPDKSNRYITTYFRKSISIADASSYSSYMVNLKRDDGVVVYVNGTEVYRNNMPSGTISYNTLASGVAGPDNGVTPISFEIPGAAFTSGTNVVAVEVHQNTVSSIDIAFDMELIGSPASPADNTVLTVATWNLFFFGADKDSNGNILGPADDQQQFNNVKTVLQLLNADIFALQEVANDNLMEKLVKELPGYSYVRSPTYSYSLRPITNPPAAHKLYVVYRSDRVVVKKERPLFLELYKNLLSNQMVLPNYPGSSSLAARNDDGLWDSGRLPYLVEVEASLNGIKRNINIVNLHAIAQNASTIGYERRKYDAQLLKDSLDQYYNNSNLLVLGDYNDDVDVSFLDNLPSPYKSYVEDSKYKVLTYELSLAGAGSTSSGKEFRDHITSSGQLTDGYVEHSLKINSEMKTNIFNYSSTTSDHLPVSASFDLKAIGGNLKSASTTNPALRVLLTNTAIKEEESVINIHPNPTQGNITLNISDNAGSLPDIRLDLWTMEGKLILEVVGDRDKVQQLLQKKVISVPKGIYMIKVVAGSNTYQTKLMKN